MCPRAGRAGGFLRERRRHRGTPARAAPLLCRPPLARSQRRPRHRRQRPATHEPQKHPAASPAEGAPRLAPGPPRTNPIGRARTLPGGPSFDFPSRGGGAQHQEARGGAPGLCADRPRADVCVCKGHLGVAGPWKPAQGSAAGGVLCVGGVHKRSHIRLRTAKGECGCVYFWVSQAEARHG